MEGIKKQATVWLRFSTPETVIKLYSRFYCYELNLVIEVDGCYHDNEEQYNLDIARKTELSKYNLTVIRFTEMEVRQDMPNVLRTIEQHILKHTDKSDF